MKIHCFRHVEFELVGHVATWAEKKKASLEKTEFFAGQLPPSNLEADLLVILGGPMGVHDDHKFPWLLQEKKSIEQALKKGTKILGLCLGAQLIASVMGAEVKKNSQQEVGWLQVRKENVDCDLLKPFPSSLPVFQWHGDTFEIPRGMQRTFSSVACSNQGYTDGENIVAFQFHPEIDQEGIQELINREYHEVIPGPYVQTPAAMIEGQKHISQQKEVLFQLLDRWFKDLS